MLNDLLKIIMKNYSTIYKTFGDNIGIPLLCKDGKMLYVAKIQQELRFFTKSDTIKKGIDTSFKEKEIIIAAGEFNKCFSDIHKKMNYFSEIMELINKYEDAIGEKTA